MNRGRSLRLVALCAGSIAAIVACTPKKISDIDSGTSTTVVDGISLPVGIVLTERERHLAVAGGLYPSTISHDRTCCWIAPDARIFVRNPRNARELSLTFLMPSLDFFREHPQSLDVRVGTTTRSIADLAPGTSVVTVPLDDETERADPIEITIHAARTFVPVREGFNADPRPLAIILLGVTFG